MSLYIYVYIYTYIHIYITCYKNIGIPQSITTMLFLCAPAHDVIVHISACFLALDLALAASSIDVSEQVFKFP